VLSADLVRARRRGETLELRPLSAKEQASALLISQQILEEYRGAKGKTRAALEAALNEIPVAARDRKLYLALKKRIDDQATWSEAPERDPQILRRHVFLEAARARRETGTIDRAAILSSSEALLGLPAGTLEHQLYSDLREAQELLLPPALKAEALVETHDLAQAQAVLLRATRVSVDVSCSSPAAYRALFRKLKFLRLLFQLQKLSRGYRLEIDGPYSLFDAVTKYGLALAQLLPALEATERYRLEAELSWGKQKERLKYLREGGRGGAEVEKSELPDEVRVLLERLEAQKAPFTVEIAEELIDVEGGVLVPDLRFVSEETGVIVYLEVLGHWSRAAVWRRVELVNQPRFTARMLFAVSERLRVSEEVLPAEAPAELYVYKGVMSAKSILERVARLSAADRVTS
jgi:hypothetical protein